MAKFPTQEEFTSMVSRIYKLGSHKKEPVRAYQRFLNQLINNSKESKLIRYIFSCLLGEPDHACNFLTVMEPPYTAWINSKDYPIKLTDRVIARFQKVSWKAEYPRESEYTKQGKFKGSHDVKGEHILISGVDYCVAAAAVERGKERAKIEIQKP